RSLSPRDDGFPHPAGLPARAHHSGIRRPPPWSSDGARCARVSPFPPLARREAGVVAGEGLSAAWAGSDTPGAGETAMKTLFAVAFLTAASFAHALDVAPPPYQARTDISGVIRVWG